MKVSESFQYETNLCSEYVIFKLLCCGVYMYVPGAMVDILNHYDYDPRISITNQLCDGLLGCSDKKHLDL
jgi:hypothetical protein